MGRIVKTYITTDDTGQTYEKDGIHREDAIQLWAVEIRMDCVDNFGNYNPSSMSSKKIFFIERQTIERLGLVPYFQTKAPVAPRTQEDDVRETLEKLLSLVGVYPEQET